VRPAGAGALLALSLLSPLPASAQSTPYAPLALQLSGGTRASGLGQAFVAGRGAEVLFFNPAQLSVLRGTTLALHRFGSAATQGSMATVGPYGRLAIGAGVQFLDYHTASAPSLYTRPGALPAGGPLTSSSLVATIAVARIIRGVRLGVAGKYVQENVGGLREGGLALDVGAARELGRTTLAIAVQHIGGGIEILGERARLPTRVSLGAMPPSILLSPYFDLILAMSVARERDGRIVPAAGAELLFQPVEGWVFVARAGARRVESGPGPQESPVNLGGSFGLDRLWIDYALQPSREHGATHRIGLRIQ
jgi:hypothetical protein